MAIPHCQQETAAYLQHLTGAPPVETHISAVFLGRHQVLKLKKAVRLSFLDFTTLAARADMARRELVLNRIAAPEIYRDVQAVCRRADGGLRLAPDGAADAEDYVVRMARVPEGDFLDVIAARGGLNNALLDALGDAVAELHARLAPIPDWDSPGGMRAIIEGNARAAHEAGLPAHDVGAWQRSALESLGRHADSLRRRAQAGLVRRAHGDLHLGNLCLWRGVPVAFDMLEFDDALATIDLGYDLAFLLMDLEFHAGRSAANRVLNRYVARTGDAGLVEALPCFLSTRAMVRAHVQAARGRLEDGARYLRMARDLLRPHGCALIAIGGLQGTGKTTLARHLAPDLGASPGALILRSDEIRKRLHGRKPEEKLPQEAYGAAANEATNAALLSDAAAALRGGHTVIADSTFLDERLRHDVETTAQRSGKPFLGLWLDADLETLLHRVAHRTNDASDAGPDVLRQAAARDPGPITWHRLPLNATTRAAGLARALQP